MTVTFSTFIPRNDSNELNEKTGAVNRTFKQICSQRKIKIIEHSHLKRVEMNALSCNTTLYLKN